MSKGVKTLKKGRFKKTWIVVILSVLLIICIRLFLFSTYYVGGNQHLPEGFEARRLVLVALRSNVRSEGESLILQFYDKRGKRKLIPARSIRREIAEDKELILVDLGNEEIWIEQDMVYGKVIGRIPLPHF